VIAASGTLPDAFPDAARVEWLEKNKIVDLFFTGTAAKEIQKHLCEKFRDQPVDIIVQPAANRRKKLLVADLESTIIQQEMLDELAAKIGIGEKVASITRRAMNGELDFAAALRERVHLLKGQPVSLLEEAARGITLMPGAEALLKTMKANGARAYLVTGGFTFFAKPIAERLGFDRVFANELILDGNVIAGTVAEPILDKNSKRDLLLRVCADSNRTLADSLAIGDGANDIPMLTACNAGGGLGVAYHAKPVVRAAVSHLLNHADLGALLAVQGYHST
jgi:phosphoserine phosphatase